MSFAAHRDTGSKYGSWKDFEKTLLVKNGTTMELSSEPGPHVLIVEDDAMIRKATRGFFEMNGLPASACSTVEEARAIIHAAAPRMMILNSELPDGSGIDLCRLLRAEGYSPPILRHTTKSEASDMRTGYDAGCTDYVVKPFDLRVLFLKSQRYLETHERKIDDGER
jgi:DNA-binding response OmpR family regulator